MKVREIMTQPVIVVREETTLGEIARIMLANRIGCVPIVDAEGKLVGIVTETDFTAKEQGVPFSTFDAPQLLGKWMPNERIEEVYKTACKMTVDEIMTTPVITLTEDDPIEEAVKKLLGYDISRIPVVSNGIPIGIVSRHDLLKLMIRRIDSK